MLFFEHLGSLINVLLQIAEQFKLGQRRNSIALRSSLGRIVAALVASASTTALGLFHLLSSFLQGIDYLRQPALRQLLQLSRLGVRQFRWIDFFLGYGVHTFVCRLHRFAGAAHEPREHGSLAKTFFRYFFRFGPQPTLGFAFAKEIAAKEAIPLPFSLNIL